jgi:acyl carrier protein
MMATPTENDLRQLITAVMRRDVGRLTPEMQIQEALGIDSLDILRLLAAAERRYDLHIADEDMAELRTYGDLLSVLGVEAGDMP